MDIDKKDLYEIALNEVERRDDSFSRGIWALALVQCDGDEEKAKIKYISLRVEELTSESKIDSLVKKDEQKIDELMGGASLHTHTWERIRRIATWSCNNLWGNIYFNNGMYTQSIYYYPSD